MKVFLGETLKRIALSTEGGLTWTPTECQYLNKARDSRRGNSCKLLRPPGQQFFLPWACWAWVWNWHHKFQSSSWTKSTSFLSPEFPACWLPPWFGKPIPYKPLTNVFSIKDQYQSYMRSVLPTSWKRDWVAREGRNSACSPYTEKMQSLNSKVGLTTKPGLLSQMHFKHYHKRKKNGGRQRGREGGEEAMIAKLWNYT